MSKYTIELRKICTLYGRYEVESWFKSYDLSDFLTENQLKVITDKNTFNKDLLAKKIVDRYFMREIGFETIGLFKHNVLIHMFELMEKYSYLIYSSSIEYDPLINVDYTEEYTRNINDNTNNKTTGNSSNNQTSNDLNITSNTPQTNINKEDILNGKYASETVGNENTSNSTQNIENNTEEKSTSNETYLKKTKGNSGVLSTSQKLIEQYRETIIHYYSEIINECDKLFMQIY